MKTIKKLNILAMALLVSTGVFAQKQITKTAHVNIFSSTVAEDISADNYVTMTSINTETGEMLFSIPVQGFEFKKSMMQRHFNNSNFMDSKQFPKIKFKGKIDDLSKVDFTKDGEYTVTVSGDLTIRAVTKSITEKGTISIANGKITTTSVFIVKGIFDYGVGKPTSKKKANNVAENIKVTVKAQF
ncbi:MAG: YceI family protein [Flavobacteriales bacterium]|nr:YceI family protein [Flavobacteriales bacterium]